jgi:co-chaperonin GroES (HSP10)
MSARLATATIPMHESAAQAATIFHDLRDHIKGIELNGTDCLFVAYDRSGEKTKGGLIIPEAYKEDQLQGKAHLLVKMSEGALSEEAMARFGSRKPKVGDWVVLDVNRSFSFHLGTRIARLSETAFIRAIITEPDLVF